MPYDVIKSQWVNWCAQGTLYWIGLHVLYLIGIPLVDFFIHQVDYKVKSFHITQNQPPIVLIFST